MDAKDYIINELAIAKAQMEVDLLNLRYENTQLKEQLNSENEDEEVDE